MRSLYAMPGDDRHPHTPPREPAPACAACGHSEFEHYFDEGGWQCWECFCDIQDRIFDTARECVELRAKLAELAG